MWFPSFSMEIDFEEKGKLIPASKLQDFLGEVSESSHWRWTEYSSEQKIKFRCPVSVSAVTTGLESHSILSFSKQRTIPNPRSYLHMSESFGWHCCPAFRSLFWFFSFLWWVCCAGQKHLWLLALQSGQILPLFVFQTNSFPKKEWEKWYNSCGLST